MTSGFWRISTNSGLTLKNICSEVYAGSILISLVGGVASENDHGKKFQSHKTLVTRAIIAEQIFWPDGTEVVGHNERGGQHRPESHLGLRLVVTEREIANYELEKDL